MSSKILNQAQAEAIYSAMCALNNVGAVAREIGIQVSPFRHITVCQRFDGSILVASLGFDADPDRSENHETQAGFAAAHELQ